MNFSAAPQGHPSDVSPSTTTVFVAVAVAVNDHVNDHVDDRGF
jgi:hypothetical protein